MTTLHQLQKDCLDMLEENGVDSLIRKVVEMYLQQAYNVGGFDAGKKAVEVVNESGYELTGFKQVKEDLDALTIRNDRHFNLSKLNLK